MTRGRSGRAGPSMGTLPHLILLGELEAVVGFEALDVVRQVGDGDGRVVSHTWQGQAHTGRLRARTGWGGRQPPLVDVRTWTR